MVWTWRLRASSSRLRHEALDPMPTNAVPDAIGLSPSSSGPREMQDGDGLSDPNNNFPILAAEEDTHQPSRNRLDDLSLLGHGNQQVQHHLGSTEEFNSGFLNADECLSQPDLRLVHGELDIIGLNLGSDAICQPNLPLPEHYQVKEGRVEVGGTVVAEVWDSNGEEGRILSKNDKVLSGWIYLSLPSNLNTKN